MLISREVDYGVRIVLLLCEANRKMDAKEISEISGVSIRFTLKILGKLTSSDLVESFRGAKGGYIISKKPKEISVYDIVRVLEGGIKVNGCFEDKTSCSPNKIALCGLRCKLEEVNLKIEKELQEITMDKIENCSGYKC
ncbi:Rrf2 family transcriptional regulator [Cetobacterium sp. 8H]|uniref:RrF2 family transcriptional regulator n=1 Tax=Cetobacterium sp. 8H TaxID=2759681 RepID=UPI00163BC44C|nr:Rrf2 family transcriptional regulator [Cetobacterium sp. 8H]MBC2850022.1 Rrf2 family transcriptional regulator [Cetobacterium sp. 8H]